MMTVPDGFHARSASTSTMVPTGLGTGMHGCEPRLQDAPIVSMRKMLCARRPSRVLCTDGKPRAPSVLRAASWLAETDCAGSRCCRARHRSHEICVLWLCSVPSVGKCECGLPLALAHANETQMVKTGARHLLACMCARNRVLVHWRDDSAHYPAIIDDYDKGRYHLLYDDGYFFSHHVNASCHFFQVAPRITQSCQ